MAKQRMLKFVDVAKEMPEKRDASVRTPNRKPKNKPRAAASAACPIANRTALCTTISPTGCA